MAAAPARRRRLRHHLVATARHWEDLTVIDRQRLESSIELANSCASVWRAALLIIINRPNYVNATPVSRAGAGQEASDLRYPVRVHVGPDDGWTKFGLCDYGIVRRNDPLAAEAEPILPSCVSQSTSLHADRERTGQARFARAQLSPSRPADRERTEFTYGPVRAAPFAGAPATVRSGHLMDLKRPSATLGGTALGQASAPVPVSSCQSTAHFRIRPPTPLLGSLAQTATTGPSSEKMKTPSMPFARRSVSSACTGL